MLDPAPIAGEVSTVRTLLAAARIVTRATAGSVVLADGSSQPLPGLARHPALDPGSAVVGVAHEALSAGQVCRTFLWPTDEEGEHRHVRVTVLAAHDVASTVLGTVLGTVLVTLHGECRGLTRRELEVLGLVVDGCSNQQVARRLEITPRTVATHVEHILVKLDVPSRTLAAVHAEREGCYVPAAARSAR